MKTKQTSTLVLMLAAFMSCTNNTTTESQQVVDNATGTEITTEEKTLPTSERNHDTMSASKARPIDTREQLQEIKMDGIPADGQYRYDMAFSESKGASRGEKVTVIIKGDSIKIVYEGDGNLKVKKGKVLDEGIILKHKSGSLIIAHDKNDSQLDVYGGCSGGPTVIDFENKKYWTC